MNLFQKHKIFFLTVILLLPSLLYSQNSKVLNPHCRKNYQKQEILVNNLSIY